MLVLDASSVLAWAYADEAGNPDAVIDYVTAIGAQTLDNVSGGPGVPQSLIDLVRTAGARQVDDFVLDLGVGGLVLLEERGHGFAQHDLLHVVQVLLELLAESAVRVSSLSQNFL